MMQARWAGNRDSQLFTLMEKSGEDAFVLAAFCCRAASKEKRPLGGSKPKAQRRGFFCWCGGIAHFLHKRLASNLGAS